ncbi:MAG: hypothetical protein RJA07_2332 [Bacteroidota bacterium]|jgi:hypothetical protein
MKKLFIFSSLFILQAFAPTPKENAKDILDKMLNAVKNHTSACYTIDTYERLMNKATLQHGKSFTKESVNPIKLYLKILDESANGTELIYIENENNNKVRVNAGKWIPVLKLSPYNSMILKDQHHTLFSAGFGFLYRIMLNAKQTSINNFDSVFVYQGDVIWNGINCYKLQLTDKNWKRIYYQPKKGETALSIGKKFLIPEYSIMEWNKNISSIVDNIDDKQIIICTSYAKKAILYIDKNNFFPVFQEMYDDKGLFERYEITNLKVNPTFTANDFKETF